MSGLRETLADNLTALADDAWAAGVLDARGRWIVLRRSGLDPRIEVRARGRVGKQDPMLLKLQEMFNGSISITSRGTVIWQVTGAQRCENVNAAVLTFLVVKERKARAHQHICKRIIGYRRESFEDRRLPKPERELRLELFHAFDRIV